MKCTRNLLAAAIPFALATGPAGADPLSLLISRGLGLIYNPANGGSISAAAIGPIKFGAIQTRMPVWGATGNTGGGYTFSSLYTAEAPFHWVRVVLANTDTANPHTYTSVAVSATTTINDTANPTGAAPVIATFNNGGSCAADIPPAAGTTRSLTLAAATQNTLSGNAGSDIVPTIACSDWVQVTSAPRADAGATLPLLLVRVYTSNGMSTALTLGTGPLGGAGLDAVFAGRIVRGSFAAGDFATTPTTAVTGITPNIYNAATAVQFLSDIRGLTVEACGDSLSQGFGSVTGQNDPYQAAAAALSTPALPIVVEKVSYQGMSSQSFDANCRQFAAATHPDVLIIDAASPNDNLGGGGSATVADFNASLARGLATASWAIQNSMVPVLETEPPFGYNGAQDAARLAYNAQIRASGYLYVDRDAALTNGATPAALQPQFVSAASPPHFNDAGTAAIVPYVTAVYQHILAMRPR